MKYFWVFAIILLSTCFWATYVDASVTMGGITPFGVVDLTSASSVLLPPRYVQRPCEIIIGDPGAASVALANDNDTPVVCVNDTLTTMTITAVKCYADAGTPTVTPIVTGGGSTSILSGALTCGTASYATGSLNGTPTQAAGATIDGNITAAGGTAKYIVIRISRTL